MKKALIVSFDLLSADEPTVSLSIASFLAYAKESPFHGTLFQVEHVSFDLVARPDLSASDVLEVIVRDHDLARIDIVALSAYVWSESLIGPLIALLRNEGYAGEVLLGGYQIHYTESLESAYPDGQLFIKGYAETSFVEAMVRLDSPRPLVLTHEPDFDAIPSPYLTGEIPVDWGQRKVRMETKRGCPYRCTFCAHRDLERNRVYRLPKSRSQRELALFMAKRVQKINVVDPVFNMGSDYLSILEDVVAMGATYTLALQTRFENIRGAAGERFLELCSQLNVCLEFGLQSIVEEECAAINRRNNIPHVVGVLEALNQNEIPYEVSLIYGLPGQSIESFSRSVEFLRDHDCGVVKAYPLMLLRGTELWHEKDKWRFGEKALGPYQIPTVVESSSFDESEWNEMRAMAEALAPTNRF